MRSYEPRKAPYALLASPRNRRYTATGGASRSVAPLLCDALWEWFGLFWPFDEIFVQQRSAGRSYLSLTLCMKHRSPPLPNNRVSRLTLTG